MDWSKREGSGAEAYGRNKDYHNPPVIANENSRLACSCAVQARVNAPANDCLAQNRQARGE